jgi:glycosyltransferase involved in cell wall biosynthesis
MPRKALTNLLNDVDLVQVVAGTPAWAFAVKDVRVPIALQVASLVGVERASKLRTERALKRLWTYAMTRANSRLEALALQRVQAVFVENSWMFRAIRRVAPGAIVRFAPPGVDTDFFSPGGYARDGFILSVGRFSDPRKNVRLLLRAYARLVSTQRAVPDLVLVGKAAASHDLAVISELGIGTRVRVYEDVSREALRDFYRGARLFVLSSDEEGLGLVILEAMATGLPVVSTDCGGPRTLVVNGVTGLLTPTGDAEALANAMLLLLTDRSLAQRMGEAGRARAVRLFSMERASRRFFRVYEHLLQQKGGRHGAS